ncbi:unnamed protein product [Brassica oleracea]
MSNGTVEEVKKIVNTLNEAQVPSQDVVGMLWLSPPYVFLPLKGGAFTGEMLVNLDIPWVILGHSERRALLNDSNEFVGDKVAYALAQGLKVIACVGDTLEQREAGSTMDVVAAQTKAIAGMYIHYIVKHLSLLISNLHRNALLAVLLTKNLFYPNRPGSEKNRSEPEPKISKKWLAKNVSDDVAATTRIIYGGSVNGGNCKELGGQADVDGFLVGGASLKVHLYCVLSFVYLRQNH